MALYPNDFFFKKKKKSRIFGYRRLIIKTGYLDFFQN